MDQNLIIEAKNNLQSLLKAQQLPVILDFWAPWCGPCQQLNPVLSRLAKEYAGKIQIIKINVDENEQAVNEYHVGTIPTLIFIPPKKRGIVSMGYQTLAWLREKVNETFGLNQ